MEPIRGFSGEYRFLSNFWERPVPMLNGLTFPSAEHAYQACKTIVPAEWQRILRCTTPGQAKRVGRQLTLRDDWEQVKVQAMGVTLRQKFTDPELAKMLLRTGDIELIEENNWGDTYWGQCGGKGQNMLGRLLMHEREHLQYIPGNVVFVFGSNLAGRHGKGAALEARNHYGAINGIAEGFKTRSYAIPTCDHRFQALTLEEINSAVERFIAFASDWGRDMTFKVTRIGCGLAYHKDEDIAPMFESAPDNCLFDRAWDTYLPSTFRYWGTFP